MRESVACQHIGAHADSEPDEGTEVQVGSNPLHCFGKLLHVRVDESVGFILY